MGLSIRKPNFIEDYFCGIKSLNISWKLMIIYWSFSLEFNYSKKKKESPSHITMTPLKSSRSLMLSMNISRSFFLGFLSAHSRKCLLLISFVVLDESEIIDKMIVFSFLLKNFTPNLFLSTSNLIFSSNGLKQLHRFWGRVLLNVVKKPSLHFSFHFFSQFLKLIDW